MSRTVGAGPRAARSVLPFLLLALLPLVHLVGSNPFLNFDDLVWLQDARDHPGPGGALRSFTTTPFAYRPLTALYVRAASALFWPSVEVLRVLDLLAVGLAGIAGFLFARPSLGTRAALTGAVLWELHPATRALGRFFCDAGGRWFLILALVALLAERRWLGGGRLAWRLLSVVSFGLAVLAKEWALLTLPALMLCDGDSGITRPIAARLRGVVPHLAIAVLLATPTVAMAIERGSAGATHDAGWGMLRRFGLGSLFAFLPSGFLQGLIGRESLLAAGIGVVATFLAVVAAKRLKGDRLVLVAGAVGWLCPFLPYPHFGLPDGSRYVAPGALPAMLLVGAALAARSLAVRRAGLVAVAAVAWGAGLGLARSFAPAPLPPGTALHLVVLSELFGFPENGRRVPVSREAMIHYLALRADDEPGVSTVLDQLRRGRAAEALGRDAAAAGHYDRAVAEARRAGPMQLPAFWLGDARLTPPEVETYAAGRGFAP